jgi:hypothetical protein
MLLLALWRPQLEGCACLIRIGNICGVEQEVEKVMKDGKAAPVVQSDLLYSVFYKPSRKLLQTWKLII